MTTALRCTLLAALTCAAPVHAQDTQEATAGREAPQLIEEAEAHRNEGHFALAADRYLAAYRVMSEAGHPQAPILLYNAANALSELPGREDDAIRLLQQFLDESTTLTDDERVRDWRSMAVAMVDELDARRGPRDEQQESDEDLERAEASTISPVGPIVLGVGGASLVVGLIIGAFSLSMDADFRGACDDLAMCPTALRPQYDEMRTYSTVADALLVAGGAVALVGLVLTLTLTEGGDAPPVSAACTDRGCLALVQGDF